MGIMHRRSWIVGLIAASFGAACFNKPATEIRSTHPDKILFDRAKDAMRQKHFDVTNLDLQTLLNTYPTSEYADKAKALLQDPRIANCGQFTTSPEKCDGLAGARPSR
jgi:outer membrane protein assembly factor BamD (BamD/ComL family)